ncbi:hypothetical protein GCM10027577_30080 [Spirosoma fluminis]
MFLLDPVAPDDPCPAANLFAHNYPVIVPIKGIPNTAGIDIGDVVRFLAVDQQVVFRRMIYCMAVTTVLIGRAGNCCEGRVEYVLTDLTRAESLSAGATIGYAENYE